MAKQTPTRSDFEDFLFAEAAMLDEWRLDEWLALFAEGASYQVPTTGLPDAADPAKALFFIADDYKRLKMRVARMKKTTIHTEWPRPHLRHLISNVRVLESKDGASKVACNFVTFRSKNSALETYVGHSVYDIDWSGPEWKIKAKRSALDLDKLFPGKVSIII
ncbi:MAG: aromatic-ring-hydroxylating dioxygenase subunit beta [Hyphomonadaceae bacterium]